MSLCAILKYRIRERFPKSRKKPSCIISHGPFPVSDLSPDAVAKQKDFLSDKGKAFVVGFLGDIKRYKNIAALTALPDHLSDGREVKILIAGRTDAESLTDTLATLSQISTNRIIRYDERLTDQKLDLLIRAVDVVFLPYTRGWNSGMATLVLCNNGRVLGSSLPVFTDLVEDFGKPWVYQYRVLDEIPFILDRIASASTSENDKCGLNEKLRRTDFDIGAKQIGSFYKLVASSRSAAGKC